MAASVYVHNRRTADAKRRSLGHVPLSGDQVAFLARKDDDARRRERLRQVRLHEKRVAQEVTARYRENLQRLQSEKRQAAHAQQRVQHELLLSDLHRKYQYCLQNMGAAQRNARKKLGELMEQAQAEKTKWVFNRDVVHQRYDYARDEDKLTEALRCARRKEVEANLRRLQELSQRQRVAASERARMEEARKVATEQERVRTLNEYRQATEQEVFTAVRPHRDDIDAYQFTRVHSAPLAATTATRWSGSVRPEVRVIRHNPQHPNATKATTDAMVHRDCVDHLQEEKRRQKEKESEVATARGRHALSQIEADKQGSHVMEWLSQLDEADRIERLRQYENAQFVQHETVKETEGELEESFAQMFGVDDHSSTGQRSVERVMLGEFSVATGSESEVLLSDLSAVSCAELPPQTPKEETNKTPSIKFEQESTHVEEVGSADRPFQEFQLTRNLSQAQTIDQSGKLHNVVPSEREGQSEAEAELKLSDAAQREASDAKSIQHVSKSSLTKNTSESVPRTPRPSQVIELQPDVVESQRRPPPSVQQLENRLQEVLNLRATPRQNQGPSRPRSSENETSQTPDNRQTHVERRPIPAPAPDNSSTFKRSLSPQYSLSRGSFSRSSSAEKFSPPSSAEKPPRNSRGSSPLGFDENEQDSAKDDDSLISSRSQRQASSRSEPVKQFAYSSAQESPSQSRMEKHQMSHELVSRLDESISDSSSNHRPGKMSLQEISHDEFEDLDDLQPLNEEREQPKPELVQESPVCRDHSQSPNCELDERNSTDQAPRTSGFTPSNVSSAPSSKSTIMSNVMASSPQMARSNIYSPLSSFNDSSNQNNEHDETTPSVHSSPIPAAMLSSAPIVPISTRIQRSRSLSSEEDGSSIIQYPLPSIDSFSSSFSDSFSDIAALSSSVTDLLPIFREPDAPNANSIATKDRTQHRLPDDRRAGIRDAMSLNRYGATVSHTRASTDAGVARTTPLDTASPKPSTYEMINLTGNRTSLRQVYYHSSTDLSREPSTDMIVLNESADKKRTRPQQQTDLSLEVSKGGYSDRRRQPSPRVGDYGDSLSSDSSVSDVVVVPSERSRRSMGPVTRTPAQSETRGNQQRRSSSRVSSSSESSAAREAHMTFLVNMTSAAGKALQMHLPPPNAFSAGYFNGDDADQPVSDNDDEEDDGSKLNDHTSPEKRDKREISSRSSSELDMDEAGEMKTMPLLPPVPMNAFDMSRPPPPAFQSLKDILGQSRVPRSESDASSAEDMNVNNEVHGVGTVDQVDDPKEELSMSDHSERDSDASHQSSVNARSTKLTHAAAQGRTSREILQPSHGVPQPPRKAARLFIPFGSDEETKDDEGRDATPQPSLADAFHQRHPAFRDRSAQRQEILRKRREELEALRAKRQQEATATTSNNGESSQARRQSAITPCAASATTSRTPVGPRGLIGRLASGERPKISAQEMRERNKRLYQKLPEVVERRRQEELLAKRRQRLNELRDKEQARRQQARQRREQQLPRK